MCSREHCTVCVLRISLSIPSQVWLARSSNVHVQPACFRHFESNHLWLLYILPACSCEVCAKNFRPFQSVIDSLVHDALKELDVLKILVSIKYLLESCLPVKCIFCRINNLLHVFNYVNNGISNNYDYAIDQVLTLRVCWFQNLHHWKC